MNHKQGFTTTELMIVIAALVVLATIALANFLGWSTNRRLKGAAGDLVSHLQWARSEAVERQTIVALTFSPGALPSRTTGQGRFYIPFVNDGGPINTGNPSNLQIDGSEVELKRVFMPPGVAITSATFTHLTGTPSDAVWYKARGFPVGRNGGTVRPGNNKRYYDVQVASASGGISLSGPYRVNH